MATKYFCCFHSYLDTLADLTDEQVGRLFRAAMLYSKTGEIPELPATEKIAFGFMRHDIDQTHEEYERRCATNRANASHRKRTQATVTDGNQTKTTGANENVNASEKENVNKKDDYVVIEKPSPETAEAEVNRVFDLYIELCPSLNEIRNRTDKRREAVRKLMEHYTIDEIAEGFQKAEAIPYLCGKGKNGWKADFDWLIQEEKFTRLLEGGYDEREKPVSEYEVVMPF